MKFRLTKDVGVTNCTFYVDEVAQGEMTTNPGGTSGFASATHTFTTLGPHTVGVECRDGAGNVGGGPFAQNVSVIDTTHPQVDPGCTNGCEPLPAEAGQPTTFEFGYSDFIGVTSCTFFVDGVAQGEMTLSNPGGTSGFASVTHTLTTLGAHTIGITCEDTSGNIGGGPFAQNVNVVDTSPPDTTITSAVDGNGDIVANGGATLSTAITFTFAGTDFVGVSGFGCSLDGATFSSCTSPQIYTGLAAGSHTFKVRAIDTSSNVDPTPEGFTWSILTPAQAIQNLIDKVQALQLQKGIGNSFNAILDAALPALQDANQNDDVAAINTLNAFINVVEAQRGNNLTDAEADELISLFVAGWIVQLLGFGLFTRLLLRAGNEQLAILAFTLILVAAVMAILYSAFRLSVELWAAQEAARAGSIPEVFEPLKAWTNSFFSVGYIVHFVAVAGFGWAILRAGLLASWVGWAAIGWSVLWLIGSLVGVGAPGMPFIMPAVIGFVLLWR